MCKVAPETVTKIVEDHCIDVRDPDHAEVIHKSMPPAWHEFVKRVHKYDIRGREEIEQFGFLQERARILLVSHKGVGPELLSCCPAGGCKDPA